MNPRLIATRRWDIAVLLALAMLAGVDRLWVNPLRQQLQAALDGPAIRSATVNPKTPMARGTTSIAVARDRPNDVAGFVASFSAEGYQPDWLVFIHALASGNQLQTGETHYQTRVIDSLDLNEHVIRLPLTGSFDQLHRFIAELHTKLPLSAIDRIQLRPARLQAGSLEAQVQISVFSAAGATSEASDIARAGMDQAALTAEKQ